MVEMETDGPGWGSGKEKRGVWGRSAWLPAAGSGQKVQVEKVNEGRMVEPLIHSFMSNIDLGVGNPL